MQYRHKKIDYTSPSGHEGGPGVGKQITPYFGTPYLDMTLAQYNAMGQTIGLKLGDTWTLGGVAGALAGNSFMLVKAQEALTLGQLVASETPTLGTATVPGAGTAAEPLTTLFSISTNINNAATVPINGDVDNWIFVKATGATLPQLRRIKYNSSSATSFYRVSLPDYLRPNSANDADAFDTLATNTNPVAIIRPYHVMVCTEAMTPLGVALGTVTQYNYTIIQIRGMASIQTIGDTTATVIGQPAVPAAAGQVAGSAAAAANIYTAGSLLMPEMVIVDGAPGKLAPFFVNFMAQ